MQTKAMMVCAPAASAMAVKGEIAKRGAAQWAQLCEAQRRSTQTVRVFCDQNGIALSTFW